MSCLAVLVMTLPGTRPAAAVAAPASASYRNLTMFRPDSADEGRAIAVQPDQLIVVAGTAGGDFALHRDASSHPHDESFGDDGYVTTDLGASDDAANAVAIAPDTSVVAAGTSAGNLALVRYDPHGHPDVSFGAQGLVSTDLGAGNDAAFGVVVRQDGSVVAAAGTGTAGVLVGYRPDGSVDTAFGAGGRVLVNPNGAVHAIAAQPDGGLLTVGADGTSVVVSRFTGTGAPDSTFGASGTVRIEAGAPASGDALVLLPDGRLLVSGAAGGVASVWRLQSSGLVDPMFGVAGTLAVNAPRPAAAKGVAAYPNGYVAVAGTSGSTGGFVAAFSADGVPDTHWYPDGVAVTKPALRGIALQQYNVFSVGGYDGDFAMIPGTAPDPNAIGGLNFGAPETHVEDAIRQPDGSFVAVARVSGAVGVVRLRPDGSLDTSFGRNGRAFTDLASLPVGLVVQPDGRIVVLGSREGTFALVRFTAGGSLDTTFGDRGRVLIPTIDSLQVTGLVGLADRRLLLVGSNFDDGSVLVRTDAEGTPDPSFGSNGQVVGTFGSLAVVNNAGIQQPDGKLVLAGPGNSIVRLNPDGSADTTFGANGATVLSFRNYPHWFGPSSLLLLPDGSIVVGAALQDYDDSALGVAHLDASGRIDTAWPPTHRSQFGYPYTRQGGAVLALLGLPDGRVLAVSGSTVGRLLPSGALDPSFGQSGLQRLTADAGAVADAWIQPDGSLLTIGAADSTTLDVAVNRIGLPGTGNGRAWGFNGVGQLGTGDLVDRRVPVPVTGPANVVKVAAGAFHGLELTADGSVWAWGWNGFGEIGDGTTLNRPRPVRVPGLDHVVDVAAGAYHSLAVRSDGTAWAWGWNVFGQVGDGTSTDRHVPVLVNGTANVRQVAAGAFHSMALHSSGMVTWGYNAYGQLGDGTNVDRFEPAVVLLGGGAGTALAVSAGLAHSAALRSDGTVMTWGWNGAGQLGDGTTIDRHSPTAIGGAGESLQISAGWVHTVSVRADGTVQSWGWNAYGQLGTGSTADRHVPGPAFGLTGVNGVAAGPYQTLAV